MAGGRERAPAHPADPALAAAFAATTYRVSLAAREIDIRIGRRNAALDFLLEETAATTWAFLTGWNPQGGVAGRTPENLARGEELRRACAGFRCHEGAGLAEEGSDHPAEQSLLVLGIGRAEAVEVGRRFGQLAVVVGTRGMAAELVWC
ncbi:MAG: DUF3293 domain-containing protein [Deltaproteobacteria bacterium]